MANGTIWDYFIQFRGKIEIDVLFELTAHLFLLKKIETINPDYYDRDYSVRYLSRLYGDIIHEEDLYEYYRKIEESYHVPTGILAESFRRIVQRFGNDKENRTLLEVFREFGGFEMEDSTSISNAFDLLVDMRNMAPGSGRVDIRTNSSLARLEARLLDAKEGDVIFDPFCGMGISVVESCKHGNSVVIRDIEPNTLAMAIINLIIHDCDIAEAECGDSLFVKEKRYDRVISELPFDLKYTGPETNDLRLSSRYISKNTLPIETVIDFIEKDGKGVILVPLGFLFGSGKVAELRKHLIIDRLIESIFYIPAGVIYGVSVISALIVINKEKLHDRVLMVDTSALWAKGKLKENRLGDDELEKLTTIARERENVDGISVSVSGDDISGNNFNLTPTVYVKPFEPEEVVVANTQDLIDKQRVLEVELERITKKLMAIRMNAEN